jgi:hypothetical protein
MSAAGWLDESRLPGPAGDFGILAWAVIPAVAGAWRTATRDA